MIRTFVSLVALSHLVGCVPLGADPAASAPNPPKLILAIVVDQFRYDYLLRFKDDYSAGFKKLLSQGAVFDDAHHISFPTVTAVGHSTFLSGATPSQSGIVGNEWFDRETNKQVTSVSDSNTKLVGGTAANAGSSPRRLLVSTLGDEIKMSGQKTKVIGISIKDRSAILPVGHMADAAYWFDAASNRWTTSTYYMETLPGWVTAINKSEPQRRSIGASWFPINSKLDDKSVKPFCSMVPGLADVRYCGSLEASPWGNEIIAEMAAKAFVEEKMGQHAGTDILAVSFSANDYVGHAVGPDDPAVRDISIRTDQLLGKLLEDIDKGIGLDNVVVVLTADHGVSPVPEVNKARKMPSGRVAGSSITKSMSDALTAKYGEGKWLQAGGGTSPYLNLDLIEKTKLNLGEVEATAANAVRQIPHIYRIYTKDQIIKGEMLSDPVGLMVRNGFFPRRNGELVVIQDPFYLAEGTGTSHGTPFNYDTHVPVIFMGRGIKPGHYYGRIAVNDIAPTLAAIAGVQEPSGSVGRILSEMFQ